MLKHGLIAALVAIAGASLAQAISTEAFGQAPNAAARDAGVRAKIAVRVNPDVLCVFNATPLEKYESYRLFLDQ